ncbi:MAG: DUF58 domain-containing protein [Acidimicrobiales bacterium]
MLTRRGKAALTAFFVMLVAGRVLGVTELFGIAAALLALVVVSVVRMRTSHVRASVSTRLSPEVIEAGQPTVLELFVENTGLVPTPASRLQLVPTGGGRHRILIPRLAPGERATVTIGLDSSRRGRHGISGYDVLLTDGLGLASQRLVSTGTVTYLVRPRTEELPHTLPVSAGPGGHESTHSAAERILTGASMLRGYVPGDDLRRIHWPTTARVGELMVREGGDPDSSNRSGTTIVLGTNRGGGDAFERSVEIAASLASVALREGMLRVLTTNGYDSGLAHGTGHLEAIGLQLATVQPQDAPLPSRHRRQGGASRLQGGVGDTDAAGRSTADSSPVSDAEAAASEFLSHIFGRVSGHDEWNVLVVVEAVNRLEDAELNPAVLAQVSQRVGTVVLVLVCGDVPRLERLARNQIAVFLPVGRAMHDVWITALDLPIGEARAVDAPESELEHPRSAVEVP